MDFLWRKVSKDEEEKIKKEAKLILDKFSKALERVEKEIKSSSGVKRDKSLREESKTEKNPEFRKLFFKNAPKTEGDDIIAERGSWK
jgi:predicted Asp-tRNA(Asn)/Glu-tRNA(Gln) amidotransferase subunit C